MFLEHSSLDSERATACCLPLSLLVLRSRPVEYYKESKNQHPYNSQETVEVLTLQEIRRPSSHPRVNVSLQRAILAWASTQRLSKILTFEALM